ncbi:amidohydrolase family protein [Rhodobacterales bacterium HKCCE2091]|nr:amidohydrolase family protein [Rhodobacterales bacterium HKCCE2091]
MLDDATPTIGPIAGLGAIDCDVHPRLPVTADLLPYFDAYWREQAPYRNIDRLELTGHPVSLPPYRREGAANGTAAEIASGLLDPNGLSAAILTLVNGTQALYDPYMADAFCQATNRWLAAEYLDADPRLRAALVVPFQHPEAAAEEIRRHADDRRFVAVVALAMGERPLGQRANWPIYRAAAESGFALSIQSGNVYRHAPTQAGFPSYLVEERTHMAQAAASQTMSLLSEGVMTEFPDMKIVMAGTGATWIFGMSWRVAKDWRGARVETPWIRESPEKILERQLRLTVGPFDAPSDMDPVLVDVIGSPDMLLYSSDYPHAHAGPAGAWPRALPEDLAPALARTNPQETYPRLEV